LLGDAAGYHPFTKGLDATSSTFAGFTSLSSAQNVPHIQVEKKEQDFGDEMRRNLKKYADCLHVDENDMSSNRPTGG
jgi:hypothetical protein